jgi:segregation and condensation protein B
MTAETESGTGEPTADIAPVAPAEDASADVIPAEWPDGGRDADLPRLVEAILFAAAEPLDEASIAARLPEGADIPGMLATLQSEYAGRGVNLVRVARKWTLRTAPDLAGRLQVEREASRRLSRAAIETLAIVAYHQPVTRAEIENIRGVAVNRGTLDVLLEAGWVKPGRRREVPGRPVTWLTTEGFLDHFGLESIKDLPGAKELKAAGLLDTRPAINVYAERALPDDAAEDETPHDADEDAIEPLLTDEEPVA